MTIPTILRPLRTTLFAALIGCVSAGPDAKRQTDEALAGAIRESLSTDHLLKADSFQVLVADGVATLDGKVGTLARAERAIARAKAVEGVRGTVCQLEIATPLAARGGRAEAVRRHLAASPALDASRVKVVVRDRVALLSGQVGSWDEQELARQLATEVPGIHRIDNRIEVSFDTVRSDDSIRAQISYQIADDPANEGLTIKVEVSEGIVRLSGGVGSSKEKERLIQHAYVTGVTEVWAEGLGRGR